MDKKLLEELIVNIEAAGLHVRNVTCDLGNKTLLGKNGLGIFEGKYYFKNPSPRWEDSKVYITPDVPHLIKLIRYNSYLTRPTGAKKSNFHSSFVFSFSVLLI